MRPPRIIIAVAFLGTAAFLTIFTLRASNSPQTITTSAANQQAGLSAFFSFRAPFSLFPPNAIITLTHDNTTAFLARPAAFGPLLPVEGLKGQLWIGSGFGDDSIQQGIAASNSEGELGCSDVPGWGDSYAKSSGAAFTGMKPGDDKSATITGKSRSNKRGKDGDDLYNDGKDALGSSTKNSDIPGPPVDDGTDDYLHHPLAGSKVSKSTDKQSAVSTGNHADIQSIQEGAEIAGKVVLLSRGGCGFLEKVKWVQRRGGIALIVGDDRKGGPLIQMYARGDTSNVTIPAIFTSRTTAHLLSSLIGSGSFIEDSIDDKGKPTLRVQHSDKAKKPRKKHTSKPTFTTTSAGTTKATIAARTASKSSSKKTSAAEAKTASINTKKMNWFKALFFGKNSGDSGTETSRPPSSGQLDWVLVNDWKDDDSVSTRKAPITKTTDKNDPKKQSASAGKGQAAGDDFVIGVQDWRDPDLVGSTKDKDQSVKVATAKTGDKGQDNKAQTGASNSVSGKDGKKQAGVTPQETPGVVPLRGGSTKPGSGEYISKTTPEDGRTKIKENQKDPGAGKPKGILNTIFGEDNEDFEFATSGTSNTGNVDMDDNEEYDIEGEDEEDGLWVTLTPTSGASPFLDTLLVLVVSPLVTLTVVYALLLVRSRIRRRRWRAPKSVVERLPVRTYQTIATSGSQSPRLPSPTSTSPTTPLLQHSPSSTTRPRPRSRTTTGIPEPGDLIRVNSNPLQVPNLEPRGREHEKNASVPSEWKKYMGKQVECVVCLEEYVDGVSRVMSLPCGHEFHVDCITPWLTTRRRTCPICKGDVVRSLARGSPSNPRYEPYHDDSDDDIQVQAAETVNHSTSSALPIPRNDDEGEGDIEQGISSPTPSRPGRTRQAGWRTFLANSLGSTSRSPRPPLDRSR